MMGAGGMGLFWIWPLLIVVGLGLLGYVGYQRVLGGTPGLEQRGNGADGGEARRILDERFARGEIDEEEYRRRRSVLG
ncbi:SHOCT domain-containing protein [Pseudonocardia sp. RS11V-5]|uniref:SHOCT domain-containing protein n=1 Tax=Pseudonocardia terrae TaxID=2905831 RepID=UPI001E4C8CF0|nr:SHOCT domain-containing protein [Pseudonocardia terrae]MCE3553165.1 SHOCT domain-containing protein [Pseudonocardia terrae]